MTNLVQVNCESVIHLMEGPGGARPTQAGHTAANRATRQLGTWLNTASTTLQGDSSHCREAMALLSHLLLPDPVVILAGVTFPSYVRLILDHR